MFSGNCCLYSRSYAVSISDLDISANEWTMRQTVRVISLADSGGEVRATLRARRSVDNQQRREGNVYSGELSQHIAYNMYNPHDLCW